MRMSIDDAIMVNAGSSVDDDIRANSASRLHDRSRTNLDSILNLDFRCDNCRGMNHCRELILFLDKPVVDVLVIRGGTQGAHSIHKVYAIGWISEYCIVIA
jgi:hypothetical protein